MFKFVATKNTLEIFHRAVVQNDIQRTRLILEEAMKDPRFNIDEITDEGLTALQFSCFAGNLEIVKILIYYGADWKIKDREGYSLLHAAAMGGTVEVVKYLLRVGIKPTHRNDLRQMPVDCTEDICTIVALLKAMLDQGFLKEMQEYMLDHPKLKRKIFKELELAKNQERDNFEHLKDLPYTSRKAPHLQKVGNKDSLQRTKSRGTFSELSDSMQSLNLIPAGNENIRFKDKNDNYYGKMKPVAPPIPPCRSRSGIDNSVTDSVKLQHRECLNTSWEQPYSDSELDRRVKVAGHSSDGNCKTTARLHSNLHLHPEGYSSDIYDEHVSDKNVMYRKVSNRTSEDFDTSMESIKESNNAACATIGMHLEDPYRNSSLHDNSPLSLPNSSTQFMENIYENLPLRAKSVPPPLPPRAPTRVINSKSPYEGDLWLTNRIRNSETDSGIDDNEATPHIAGLSLEDPLAEEFNAYHVERNGNSLYPQNFCIEGHVHSSEALGSSNVEVEKYNTWSSRDLLGQQEFVNSNDRKLFQRAQQYEDALQKHLKSMPFDLDSKNFQYSEVTMPPQNLHYSENDENVLAGCTNQTESFV